MNHFSTILATALATMMFGGADHAEAGAGRSCSASYQTTAKCWQGKCSGVDYLPLASPGGKAPKACEKACRKDRKCKIVKPKKTCGGPALYVSYKANMKGYDNSGASPFIPDALERACSVFDPAAVSGNGSDGDALQRSVDEFSDSINSGEAFGEKIDD